MDNNQTEQAANDDHYGDDVFLDVCNECYSRYPMETPHKAYTYADDHHTAHGIQCQSCGYITFYER